MRALFAKNETQTVSTESSSARSIWQKWTTSPNTMARGPLQLHRLKAGPGCRSTAVLTSTSNNQLPSRIYQRGYKRYIVPDLSGYLGPERWK